MKDSLKKWYRNGFDNLKVIVPYSAWENIKESISAWPKNWYKNNAQNTSVRPPENAWSNISQKLASFNQEKKYRRALLYHLTTVIICFILIPLGTTNYNVKPRTNENSNTHNSIQKNFFSESMSTSPSKESMSSRKELPSNSPYLFVENQFVNSTEKGIHITKETKPEINKTTNIQHSILLLPIKELNQLDLNDNLRKIQSIDIENKKNQPNWLFGTKFSVNGTSLITPKTLQSTSYKSALKGRLGYSVSYGISAAHMINHRNSISMDLMFNDRKSFAIYDIANQNSIRRQTKFNFITFSGLYRRNILKSKKQLNQQLNLGLGLFGSVRTQVQENSDNPNFMSFENNYKKYDFGINSGLEYSVDLSHKVRVFTGFQYQFGLINLFNGADKVPASLYSTKTNALGFNIGMYYKF